MRFARRPLTAAFGIAALPILSLAMVGCGSSANNTGTGGAGGAGTGGAGGLACATGGAGGGAIDSDAGVVSCGLPQYAHTFGFGAIFEGWSVSQYSTSTLFPQPATEAGPAMGTVVELDTADGAPSSPNGSLKLSVPFDSTGQLLLLGNVFSAPLNMAGTTITAQIKLDSGLIVGPSDTARAFLVLKSTVAYNYSAGPAVVLDPSAGWTTLTIDGDVPSVDSAFNGYNPCDVREIDIEIHTGDTGMYRAAVMHLDAISITPKTCH